MTLVLLNLFLAALAILSALCLGGVVEARGAKLVVLMIVVGTVGRLLQGALPYTFNPSSFAQDATGFIGFSLLGIYSKRVWPLWAAAFQLLSVGAHLMMMLDIAMRPIVYAWMKSGPTWAVYVLLIIGTVGHQQRLRRAASDPFSRG